MCFRNLRNALSDSVEGVYGAMDLTSCVRTHREFMSTMVQRAMDGGGPPRTLGYHFSVERIRWAVEEFRKSRAFLVRADTQFIGKADCKNAPVISRGRSICADDRYILVRTWCAVLELSFQSLLGKSAEVTYILLKVIPVCCSCPIFESLICLYPAPVANVEPILQVKMHLSNFWTSSATFLRASFVDESIRDNLSAVVESKVLQPFAGLLFLTLPQNAYTT